MYTRPLGAASGVTRGAPSADTWPLSSHARYLVDQLLVRDGVRRNTSSNQPVEQLSLPEASVEAIADLVQVFLQVFAGNTAMGAARDALGLRDDVVNERKQTPGGL